MPRVAVIGCGSAGRRHIANLRALGCKTQGFDLMPGDGIRSCWDVGEYPADAIVVATPWDQHLLWVKEAIERGLPFYVEKPLGSLEQLPRWRELAAMDLPVNQVGYQLRFHPRYQAMRRYIPKPTGGMFRCDFDIATWPGGAYGPANLEASHELDLALDCGLTTDRAILADRSEYFRDWWLWDEVTQANASFGSAAELGDQMYVDAMAHFLDCVRDGKQTICPLADGLRVLEALCLRS